MGFAEKIRPPEPNAVQPSAANDACTLEQKEARKLRKDNILSRALSLHSRIQNALSHIERQMGSAKSSVDLQKLYTNYETLQLRVRDVLSVLGAPADHHDIDDSVHAHEHPQSLESLLAGFDSHKSEYHQIVHEYEHLIHAREHDQRPHTSQLFMNPRITMGGQNTGYVLRDTFDKGRFAANNPRF